MIAAVTVLLVSPTAIGGRAKPRLAVVDRAPLTIAGSGFLAGERVSVVVVTGYGARRARVVANRGRFSVTFRLASTGCGTAWMARAVGSRGSVAALRLGPASPCVPPPIR